MGDVTGVRLLGAVVGLGWWSRPPSCPRPEGRDPEAAEGGLQVEYLYVVVDSVRLADDDDSGCGRLTWTSRRCWPSHRRTAGAGGWRRRTRTRSRAVREAQTGVAGGRGQLPDREAVDDAGAVGGGARVSWRVLTGDCVELMAGMPDGSVDAVVCDPPAGIAFMSKAWDGNLGGMDEVG